MLNSEDKKWLSDEIDSILDRRLDEQNQRLENEMNRRFDEQDQRLNTVMDERFADMIESFDRRMDEKFGRMERKFEMVIENRIMPMLNAHIEVLPGAYQSYSELENRVEALELDQDILKNALKARM